MRCLRSSTTTPAPYRRLKLHPRSGGSRPIVNRLYSTPSSGRGSRWPRLPRAALWPNLARKVCRLATGSRRTSCPFRPCGSAGFLFTARIMRARSRRERSGSRWMRRPPSVPASIRRPAAASWPSSAWRAGGDFTDRSISELEPGFSRSPQPSCSTASYWQGTLTRVRSALPATTPGETASRGWCKAALHGATVIGSSANHALT